MVLPEPEAIAVKGQASIWPRERESENAGVTSVVLPRRTVPEGGGALTVTVTESLAVLVSSLQERL